MTHRRWRLPVTFRDCLELYGCTINYVDRHRTGIFKKCAAEIWNDDERYAFIDWISEHSDAGDVIPGGHGLRKVRWVRAGMGKRSGARVIYFVRTAQGEVWLLMAYAKSKFDNLPTQLLLQWKEAIDG